MNTAIQTMQGSDSDYGYFRDEIRKARVVIFVSNLTDIRAMIAHLKRLGVSCHVALIGMAAPAMRERFHELQDQTGWQTLPQVFADGRFIGGYDELFAYDFGVAGSSNKKIPWPARVLGIGGLIPFIIGAAALWWAPGAWRADALRLLLLYSAVILSFVGAVHWGRALSQRDQSDSALWLPMSLSVVPALVAWGSFVLPPTQTIAVMLAAFIGQYFFDASLVRRDRLPAWYRSLRGGLTIVVSTCLIAAALALATRPPAAVTPAAATDCYGCDSAPRPWTVSRDST